MCYTCFDNLNIVNQWFATFVEHLRNPFLSKAMVLITNIGSPINIWMMSFCLMLILWLHKKYHHLVQLSASLAICTIAVLIIKFVVKLQRPAGPLIQESGYSFASGHAAIALLFFLLIAYSYKSHIASIPLRKLFIFICCGLALIIGFSRIYLGVHYATDVVAGFLIGLTVFAISVILLDSYERAHTVIESKNKL